MGDEGKASIRRDPARKGFTAAVVVDPRVAVVESPETANRADLDDALDLLVKWAVRAYMCGESGSVEAPTGINGARYGRED